MNDQEKLLLGHLERHAPSEEEIKARVIQDPNHAYPTARVSEMRRLVGLARYTKMKAAVETGSFAGVFAQAFRLVCPVVFSIDNCSDLKTRQKGPGCYIRERGIWNQIHFVWGEGAEKLPHLLPLLQPPWLFFHDSDHSYGNVLRELLLARKLGAMVLACHDVEDHQDLGTRAAFLLVAEKTHMRPFIYNNLGILLHEAWDFER